MNADNNRIILDELTSKVIACVYTVSNTLGCGFLEKVYENALVQELLDNGLSVNQQHPLQVRYKDKVVGEYFADILVENLIIVELKANNGLQPQHLAQCMNYLKATQLQVCLLINFGKPKAEIKRIVNHF